MIVHGFIKINPKKMHNTKCNVLIVGFGPTGSVLANLLSKYNITIHILEKENEIYNLPRAVHFDDEIMRTFKLSLIHI